jgi:hypothetical protein
LWWPPPSLCLSLFAILVFLLPHVSASHLLSPSPYLPPRLASLL